MPTETIAPTIFESIIEDINSIGKTSIIAFNNDHTPFELVFYVLKTVVPLTEQEAYEKTYEIHHMGESVVYVGAKDHCQKIGDALDAIKVRYSIV